jgi:hypothetical protein
VTLGHQPTISQYEMMQRADTLLSCGRYFGGTLTSEQLQMITLKVEL